MQPDRVRVYTQGGTVAHLLDYLSSPNDRAAEALCGRRAWPGFWFGTGTQVEHERAMDLRLCISCSQILTERSGGITAR